MSRQMGGSLGRFWETRRHLDKGKGLPMGRERDGADDMRENCDNATKEPEVEERQENRHPAYVRFGREGRKRNR